MTHNVLLILIAFLLVLGNGFFVAAEFAIVKLRESRLLAIKQRYPLRGKILNNVHAYLDNTLSACQLGITLTSLGLGWIGEPAVANVLHPLFESIGIFSNTTVTIAAFTLAFCIITLFHIVLGELVPKSIAIRKAEDTSLWISIPLFMFNRLMYPAIWLLNFLANGVLKLLGLTVEEKNLEESYSPEEFKFILNSVHLREVFSKQEVELLKKVIDFSDLVLGDLLRPADEMVKISLAASMDEILETIAEKRFSRYPVFDENVDNIIGILHVKDLLVDMKRSEFQDIDLQNLIRPVITAYQDELAGDLFNRFREGPHFAVVKNKNEHVVGFVTLENILNHLIGNIHDEFSKIKPEWIEIGKGVFLMKGNASIYSLERALGIDIETEANTLSGLLMAKLERMPEPNERVEFPKFDIVVHRIRGPKILLVKIYSKQENSEVKVQ